MNATATDNQVRFITDLQADKAWKADVAAPGPRDFTYATGDNRLDKRMEAGTVPAEFVAMNASAWDLPADSDEQDMALWQLDIAWEAHCYGEYIARHEAGIAALTIDPTTLTKSEASATIDLLKVL